MKPKSLRQTEFKDFYLPFGGRLNRSNRRLILAKKIPWDEFEEWYAANFASSGLGAPTFKVRIAPGALIIKKQLQLTDEEGVLHVEGNPYLPYFLGVP